MVGTHHPWRDVVLRNGFDHDHGRRRPDPLPQCIAVLFAEVHLLQQQGEGLSCEGRLE